jgi:hypothetical protein
MRATVAGFEFNTLRLVVWLVPSSPAGWPLKLI